MMNSVNPLVLMVAMFVLITGCTAKQFADNTASVNALLDLQLEYEQVKYELNQAIDLFPVETGLDLLALEAETDAYVDELTQLWQSNPAMALATIKPLYERGRRIYLRGELLIKPRISQLPPEVYETLRQFEQSAREVDRLYQQMAAGENDSNDMMRAGLEFATLALKIGVLVL